MPPAGETITTASGLQYVDILVGQSGEVPRPGTVVGFNAVVSISGKVLFDTANDKPVAFKVSLAPRTAGGWTSGAPHSAPYACAQLGQRPFQNVVCEGVEEGLKGMRAGSKRKLLVPAKLAPQGVQLPDGVPLEYIIEVTEVLPGYF